MCSSLSPTISLRLSSILKLGTRKEGSLKKKHASSITHLTYTYTLKQKTEKLNQLRLIVILKHQRPQIEASCVL
nr:hypothetical protein CFP56_41959 [Quercus suber]